MNIKIIEEVVKMIRSLSDLTQKVIDAGDPQKYANGVKELNHGVDETYARMREIIINNEKFSEDEKIERLQKLAVQEQEALKVAGEAVKSNRENAGKVALEVFKGLLTCGVSFAPSIAKGFKKALSKENSVAAIDTKRDLESIEIENIEDAAE